MDRADKPLAWLHGEIRTPPFSRRARLEAGYLLRLLQRRESIGMPHSRPMPTIGARCHELTVRDRQLAWRIVYRIDSDAVVLVTIFAKKTGITPQEIIDLCRERLEDYDDAAK